MVGDKRRIWQVAFGVLLLVAFSASAFAQEEAAEAAAGLDVIEMFRPMGPTSRPPRNQGVREKHR